ncbi:MAG: hypothetical protein HY690_09350 [Chloroflexi bacterium]|nr:hypothetical protein [Chloroflexota bacterium]
MGVPRPSIVIAPMGIGEVLDTGFTLTRRNFRRLVVVGAWGLVPAYVVYEVARALFTVAAVGSSLGSLLLTIGSSLAALALALACARLIEPTGEPTELEPLSLYHAASRRLGFLLLWTLLAIILAIPLLILLPLGIFLGVRWSVSWIALALEGIGPIASLRRSWSLTRAAWWHTFVVILAAGAIGSILGIVAAAVFGIVGGILSFVAGSPAILELFSTLGSAVVGVLLTPFEMAIFVVLYYELRARSEGFDLEQRARQVTRTE